MHNDHAHEPWLPMRRTVASLELDRPNVALLAGLLAGAGVVVGVMGDVALDRWGWAAGVGLGGRGGVAVARRGRGCALCACV
jgi:hypothetical protein